MQFNFVFPLVLGCFLLASIPFGHLGGDYDPNYFAGLLAVVLFVQIVLLVCLRKGISLRVDKVVIAIVLTALTSIAILLSVHSNRPFPDEFFVLGILIVVLTLLPTVSSYLDTRTCDSLRGLEDAVVYGMVLVVGATIIGPNFFDAFESISYAGFVFPLEFGSLRQPNSFATVICAAGVISVFRYPRVSLSGKVLLCLIWLLFAWTVALTSSRIGAIVLACSSVWLIIFNRKELGMTATCLFALLSGGGYGLGLWSPTLDGGENQVIDKFNQFSSSDAGLGIVYRISMLVGSWELGKTAFLLGHGFDTFKYVYPEWFSANGLIKELTYPPKMHHPHNELAYFWVSGGLVGVLGVLFPFVFFVLYLCRKQLSLLVIFLPIGFHSMTEFPLHSSGLHLLLLVLGCLFVALKTKPFKGEDQIFLESWGRRGLALIVLIVTLPIVLLIDAVSVAHQARLNSFDWTGQHTFDSYQAVRVDDRELGHWLYGPKAQLTDIRNRVNMAMAFQDAARVNHLLQPLKSIVKEYNGRENWALLAAAYAGLGKRGELIGFLDYVGTLDPVYSKELKQFYRID